MRKKNKKLVSDDKRKIKSKKYTHDGIEFKSGLEVYMWRKLVENGVQAEYESMSFELVPSFEFPCSSFERRGKGDYLDNGNKKVRGITYTPDFIGDRFVIETKGHANESFPLRWKLFKKLMVDLENDVELYMPRNHKDCDKTIELILNRR